MIKADIFYVAILFTLFSEDHRSLANAKRPKHQVLLHIGGRRPVSLKILILIGTYLPTQTVAEENYETFSSKSFHHFLVLLSIKLNICDAETYPSILILILHKN
jgi:hypothetical protein